MKKNLGIILAILAFFGIGFCLYMEGQHSMTHIVKADMTEEEILSEMPEIAISEEDFVLEEYVLSLPEVQDMLEWAKDKEKGGHISVEKAEELLSDWIEEDWRVLELAALHDSVMLSFMKEGEKSIYYTFFPDGSYPMQKTVGLYGTDWKGRADSKCIYQNLNGEITKHVPKRQWFYWIEAITEKEQ